jgi:ferredoxin-NADP reductase
MLPEPTYQVRLADKYPASDSAVCLRLEAAAGGALPAWEPGAHVDLLLPNGLTRQYSLCGDPNDRACWRLGVLRETASRGGSAYIHDHLKPGAVIAARGPRNHFPFVKGKTYRFIAGGIGITPILPMICAAEHDGARWRLFYGGRRRSSMAFVDEVHCFGERAAIIPQDEFGMLDLDRILDRLSADDAVYCCGPEPLLEAIETRFAAGLKGTLSVERFKASDGAQSGDQISFKVVLRRSGRTVDVGPGESILEALEREGLRPLFSCRQGQCGSCETTIIAGRPDHRDSVLSESERMVGKTMMICLSRSHDPVLELDL